MGQKINPTGFRLSVLKNWSSKWYANRKNFPGMLNEDIKVREYLKKKLAHASVGRVIIERPSKNARITIYSSRPGVVIGKKGEDIEVLRGALQTLMGVPVQTEQSNAGDGAWSALACFSGRGAKTRSRVSRYGEIGREKV
mgnify:CR=1 FL=1